MIRVLRTFSASTLFVTLSVSASPFPSLQKLEREGAKVSALAINLRDGSVVASLNASQRLSPASLTKTLIAATALEKWGSEYSFTTRIFITGKREHGVLHGDLIVEGAGDPYLTNEKLWFLATDVARLGIHTVDGNLVLNTSRFGAFERDGNREHGRHFSHNAYDSPLSAAAVNFSVLAIVAGGADSAGQPAFVSVEPYPLPQVRVQGRVSTSTGASKLNVSRASQKGVDTFTASGRAALGDAPLRAYRSVGDADVYASSVIRAFLKSAGVAIRGQNRIDKTTISKDARLLTQVDGFPLSWQLQGLFKVSNNFIADMLTIDLNDKPGATLANGTKILTNSVETILKQEKIANVSPLIIDSGSGLTPENRVSAEDFVAIFRHMYANTREFPTFLSALPIPGAEGTVKKRFAQQNERHLQDRIRAKTGTLSEPIDAVSLGGYCRLATGDWAAFATIVNGTPKKPNVGVQRIHDAMDADLAMIFPPETGNGSEN